MSTFLGPPVNGLVHMFPATSPMNGISFPQQQQQQLLLLPGTGMHSTSAPQPPVRFVHTPLTGFVPPSPSELSQQPLMSFGPNYLPGLAEPQSYPYASAPPPPVSVTVSFSDQQPNPISREGGVHINFSWRTLEDVNYPRMTDASCPGRRLRVWDATRSVISLPLEQVLNTRGAASALSQQAAGDAALPPAGCRICRDYDQNQCCSRGARCGYIHHVTVDAGQAEARRRIRHRRERRAPQHDTNDQPAECGRNPDEPHCGATGTGAGEPTPHNQSVHPVPEPPQAPTVAFTDGACDAPAASGLCFAVWTGSSWSYMLSQPSIT